jgi:hypothetical protein
MLYKLLPLFLFLFVSLLSAMLSSALAVCEAVICLRCWQWLLVLAMATTLSFNEYLKLNHFLFEYVGNMLCGCCCLCFDCGVISCALCVLSAVCVAPGAP